MKSSKYLQILIVGVVMALGVTVGASVNAYGQATPGEIGTNSSCGNCARADQFDLTYCNFTLSGTQCAGNDGGACGGVSCWPQQNSQTIQSH